MPKPTDDSSPRLIELAADGTITVGDAAFLLGVVRETINAHIRRDGAPVAVKGKAGVATRIILRDYIDWLAERDARAIRVPGGAGAAPDAEDDDDDQDGQGRPLSDEARYKRARAHREEMAAMREEIRARRETVQVVDIKTAADVVEDRFLQAGSALRNLGSRCAPRCAIMSDTREIAAYLESEVGLAMSSLTDALGAIDELARERIDT